MLREAFLYFVLGNSGLQAFAAALHGREFVAACFLALTIAQTVALHAYHARQRPPAAGAGGAHPKRSSYAARSATPALGELPTPNAGLKALVGPF